MLDGQPILLCVEDNLEVQEGIKTFLESQISGLIIRVADTLEGAISQLSDDRVDVVLTDIFYPGNPGGSGREPSGHELIRIVYNHPSTRSIVMSSALFESDKKDFAALGIPALDKDYNALLDKSPNGFYSRLLGHVVESLNPPRGTLAPEATIGGCEHV